MTDWGASELNFPWPRFVANLGCVAAILMGKTRVKKVLVLSMTLAQIILEFTRADATLQQCMVRHVTKLGPVIKAFLCAVVLKALFDVVLQSMRDLM